MNSSGFHKPDSMTRSTASRSTSIGIAIPQKPYLRCFGRDEAWGSAHYEKDGYPTKGGAYFRLGVVPISGPSRVYQEDPPDDLALARRRNREFEE